MKTETAVAIILLATFALSSIAIMPIKLVNASPGGSTLTLSDAELMLPEFAYEWGPGTLTGKTLIAPGVKFDFTGLQPAADTGVGDNFPINGLAGGAYKDYGYGFAGSYDFSGYTQYSLGIENVGTEPVTVALRMNTGWTGDWSGGQWKGPDGFGASPARDTYWQSDWVYIGPGECKVVTLNFSSANVYNALDDPVLGWQHPDGTSGVPVQRLDEVSNIIFTVLGNDAGSVIVSGTFSQLYIDPPVTTKTHSDVGTSFVVSVTLEDFANLAGFDIKLTWDGTLITCTGVDYSTTLDALWGVGMWSAQLEQSGVGFYRLVAVALATSASNVGASVLFKMTFHVDKSSSVPLQTPIHFDLVHLSDNSVPIPKPIIAELTDGMYYMGAGVDDVAVTNVLADHTWVYQGHSVNINVTVLNKGDFPENVAITLYYNITDNKIIGTQNIALLVGQTRTISFVWDTTGAEFCHNYTLTAVAAIVPEDNNPADNTFADGKVKIRIPGDVDGDGKVDMADISIIIDAFLSYPSHPRWNPNADLNTDNSVDMADISIVVDHFLQSC